MVQTASYPPVETSPARRPDIIPQAKAKVSTNLVEEVSQLSGLSKGEIASLIGQTERSLSKTPHGAFSTLISEHLLLLRNLFEHGLAFFDQNKKSLTKWLKTPLPELASPETGFFPVWPATPPPPLDQMTAFEPFDLTAYAARRDQQPAPDQGQSAEKHPYPTPFSLLDTSTGIRLVDDVMSRIEAGVYL